MIAYLIFLWLTFFSPWLFRQLYPIPSDIISGMYYPWIEQKLGPLAGIPVKNPILTDVVSQFWIWRNWGIETIKLGIIPIWNPYSLAGQQMSPWFHTIIFSPLNIFYFIFDKINAMSAIVAIQLLLSLLFSYLFLKTLTNHRLASVFGSIAFSFSAYLIGWLTWGTITSTLSFIPLCLYAILKIKSDNKPIYHVIFYISHLFALLSGHPQTYLYFLIIILSFMYFNKILFKTIVTFTLSILTASIILYPSINIIGQSIRSDDQFIKNNNYGFIHPFEQISSYITPSFFGNPATNNYWGLQSNFQEKLIWFGVIPFTFAISWLIQKYLTKKFTDIDWWLIFLFFLGILLSTKYPLGSLVYHFQIPLLSSSPAGRGFILTIFASTVMATKYFSTNKHPHLKTTISIICSLYLTLLIYKFFTPTTIQNITISFRNLSISTILIAILLLIRKFPIRIYQAIIILLTSLDLLYFAIKYTPFTPAKYYFPQNQLLESIRPKSDYYRVEREQSELIPPNMWQPYGLSSSQGYDPTLSKNYLSYLQDQKLVIDPTRFVEWKAKEIPLVNELGNKYAITLKRDLDNRISPQGSPPSVLTNLGWRLHQESGSVAVLINPNYKPPYFLVNDGELVLKTKTDTIWEFDVKSPNTNQLIVIENHIPQNWTAQVDNQPLSISFYKKTFKSISIPPGQHQVTLRYRNQQFTIGLYISVFSILTFIIYLIRLKKTYDTQA